LTLLDDSIDRARYDMPGSVNDVLSTTETSQQAGYRVHEWGSRPVWEEFARPRPASGEVLVKVEACGVGLTVLNCINGDLAHDPALLPRVPGHELVGRVIEVGPGADRDLVGHRVVAYFYLSCATCRECSAGRHARCERLAGWVGVHRDGGYAPFTTLPAFNAVVVPDDLDPIAATVVPDAVATPVHVCRLARVRPTDRVVVIGAGGGVGAHLLQVARLHGAEVTGFDISEPKLEAVRRWGANPVDARAFSAIDPDRLWPDGRPSVIVDLVGTEDSLAWSVAALGTGGRLMALTTFRDRQFPVSPRELVFREITIHGSRYASRADVATAAALVTSNRIQPVIGDTAGPGDVLALHAELQRGSLIGRGALVWT
jgi:D-arabinose 1-dehydrogenase-like Zn-dependent alcohol dehydrogenase